jgi:hypothetical protein
MINRTFCIVELIQFRKYIILIKMIWFVQETLLWIKMAIMSILCLCVWVSNNNFMQNSMFKYWKIHKSCHWSTFLVIWIFTEFFCSRFWEQFHSLHHCLALLRLLPVAVYVVLVTFLRYHLFVWTVFSPKLLYEATHTLVISFVMLLINILAVTVVKNDQT